MLAGWSRGLRFAAGGLLWIAAAVAGSSFAAVPGSSDTVRLLDWVKRTNDHRGRPFAVVDKRLARIYVFDASGVLAGQSPVLLGATRGDHTVPGVGLRAQSGEVREDERTTPAGRFDSIPGSNLSGEHVVWVDYASAFAIHRLRPGRAEGPRASRLATDITDDNRVSLGCVVVPVAFYERVVQRVLGQSRSVVYVLPETRAASDLFSALEQQ
jgi:hypothetical protein